MRQNADDKVLTAVRSLLETAHLIRSPNNRRRLFQSLRRAGVKVMSAAEVLRILDAAELFRQPNNRRRLLRSLRNTQSGKPQSEEIGKLRTVLGLDAESRARCN